MQGLKDLVVTTESSGLELLVACDANVQLQPEDTTEAVNAFSVKKRMWIAGILMETTLF